jgi:hypothetical protein
MRIVRLLAALFVALLAAPALAAETQPAPNPTVLMSPVALPIVVDGRLVNYVFVTMRLGLSAKADPQAMRAKEPFFRDALVRAGHRQPFVRDDNYTLLDDNRLKASILHDAPAIVGPGMVVSVQIIREQAQHYDGLPKPKAGPSAR